MSKSKEASFYYKIGKNERDDSGYLSGENLAVMLYAHAETNPFINAFDLDGKLIGNPNTKNENAREVVFVNPTYSTLSNDPNNHSLVDNIQNAVANNPNRHLIMPVNVGGNHWVLAYLEPSKDVNTLGYTLVVVDPAQEKGVKEGYPQKIYDKLKQDGVTLIGDVVDLSDRQQGVDTIEEGVKEEELSLWSCGYHCEAMAQNLAQLPKDTSISTLKEIPQDIKIPGADQGSGYYVKEDVIHATQEELNRYAKQGIASKVFGEFTETEEGVSSSSKSSSRSELEYTEDELDFIYDSPMKDIEKKSKFELTEKEKRLISESEQNIQNNKEKSKAPRKPITRDQFYSQDRMGPPQRSLIAAYGGGEKKSEATIHQAFDIALKKVISNIEQSKKWVQERKEGAEDELFSQQISLIMTDIDRKRNQIIDQLHEIITEPTKDQKLSETEYQAIYDWVARINPASKDVLHTVYNPESYAIPEELKKFYKGNQKIVSLLQQLEEYNQLANNVNMDSVAEESEKIIKTENTQKWIEEEFQKEQTTLIKENIIEKVVGNIVKKIVNEISKKKTLSFIDELDIQKAVQFFIKEKDITPREIESEAFAKIVEEQLKEKEVIVKNGEDLIVQNIEKFSQGLVSAYKPPVPPKPQLKGGLKTKDIIIQKNIQEKPKNTENKKIETLEDLKEAMKNVPEGDGQLRGRRDLVLNYIKEQREKNPNEVVNCSGLDCSNLPFGMLQNVDLSGVNFEGANFTGANLKGVKVANSNFTNANLSDANLVGVGFKEANFAEADFKGVNFGNSDVGEANFTAAKNLTAGQFSKATGLDKVQGLDSKLIEEVEKVRHEKIGKLLNEMEIVNDKLGAFTKILEGSSLQELLPEERRAILPTLYLVFGRELQEVEDKALQRQVNDVLDKITKSVELGKGTIREEDFSDKEITQMILDVMAFTHKDVEKGIRTSVVKKSIGALLDQGDEKTNAINKEYKPFLSEKQSQDFEQSQQFYSKIEEKMRQTSDVPLNLSGFDGSGLSFESKDLSGADLSNTNLTGVIGLTTEQLANINDIESLTYQQLVNVKGIVNISASTSEDKGAVKIEGLDDEMLHHAKLSKLGGIAGGINEMLNLKTTDVSFFNRKKVQPLNNKFKENAEAIVKLNTSMVKAANEGKPLHGFESWKKAAELQKEAYEKLKGTNISTKQLKEAESLLNLAGRYINLAQKGLDANSLKEPQQQPTFFQRVKARLGFKSEIERQAKMEEAHKTLDVFECLEPKKALLDEARKNKFEKNPEQDKDYIEGAGIDHMGNIFAALKKFRPIEPSAEKGQLREYLGGANVKELGDVINGLQQANTSITKAIEQDSVKGDVRTEGSTQSQSIAKPMILGLKEFKEKQKTDEEQERKGAYEDLQTLENLELQLKQQNFTPFYGQALKKLQEGKQTDQEEFVERRNPVNAELREALKTATLKELQEVQKIFAEAKQLHVKNETPDSENKKPPKNKDTWQEIDLN